jgi:undecaprenyl-phosphate 4-deoxy-4-formamido-L-arabinose transferase
VLPTLASQFEVVLVNDASPDHSWATIVELTARHPWVRGINLMRNYGQHNALLCGIRTSKFDVIVSMDDDLQHPPEEIHRLLDRLSEGYDVVYGTPAVQQHGFLRDLASTITKRVLRGAMGAEIASTVSAFRAIRREVCPAFESYQSSFVSIDVLLTWGTRRFGSVAVRHDARAIGQSNYTVTKLVRHALNMVTGFSTAPLQFASIVGFGFTLFGMAVLVFVVGRYLVNGGSIPGFSFLASVIAIFSGAQLFALGVIGEYLARMHARSMGHPTYIVRDIIHHAPLATTTDFVTRGASG